jgi:hypothetical protein
MTMILITFWSWNPDMFLKNVFANFLGSLAAAVVAWYLVTRFYEISRSKRNKNELLAVSYALIKREIDAASQLCQDHISARSGQISASGPITQAWETLHSMEAFKYFSPTLSEKLVKYYSLVFRLKENVRMSQMLFANRGVPVPGADPMAGVSQKLRGLENQVCKELLSLESQLQSALDNAVSKLGKREKGMFEEAYEKRPVRTS